MAIALDEIAERIRSLGAFAPGSFSAFAVLSAVKDENGRPKAMDMVATLAADQEIIADLAQKVITAAEANNDQPSVDLAVRRMEVHQKHGWMLRSHLE
jgi:starvation-inducible DNA-binding protein